MKKTKKQNKGFSLVELVIVVAIMAILVGILAPQYIKYVERSRKSADASNAENFATAVKVANADGAYEIAADTYTITISAKGTDLNPKESGTPASPNAIAKAFTEYVGANWAETKLKSSKWSTIPIKIECVVKSNGSVTVTYTPSELADFLNEKTPSDPDTP